MPLSSKFLIAVVSILVASGAQAQPSDRADAARIVAAEVQASGGSAWNRITAEVATGSADIGGGPGRFSVAIDLVTGENELVLTTGPRTDRYGLDANGAWIGQDGIVTPIDLPGAEKDARAQAWLSRRGWRSEPGLTYLGLDEVAGGKLLKLRARPRGASEITLWFDPATHRMVRSVIDGDSGPLLGEYSDWRRVQGALLPFRERRLEPTGQELVLVYDKVALKRRAPRLHRPASSLRGAIAGAATETVSFAFSGEGRGHIIVDAAIDGHATKLIFDTGAANYIVPSAAEAFGLDVEGGVNVGGVGETSMTGGYAATRTVAIGRAVLTDQDIIVGPLPDGAIHPRPGVETSGLTGFEFLSTFRTTIDYSRQTLTFSNYDTPVERRGTAVPFVSDGHLIYVEGVVNGATGLFRIDTGDPGGVTLFKTFTDRLGLDASGMGSSGTQEMGGDLRTGDVVLADFRLAGKSFEHLAAKSTSAEKGAFGSRTIAGNIGAQILAQFRLTLDYRNRTIDFEPLQK